MSNRCIAWHEPKKISSSWSEMCSNNNNYYFWMHLHTYLVPLYSFTLFYIFYTILLFTFVNTCQRPTKSSTKPLAKEIPGKLFFTIVSTRQWLPPGKKILANIPFPCLAISLVCLEIFLQLTNQTQYGFCCHKPNCLVHNEVSSG